MKGPVRSHKVWPEQGLVCFFEKRCVLCASLFYSPVFGRISVHGLLFPGSRV